MGKYYAEGLPEPDEWLVFVSYSHDDKQLMERLGLHLGPRLPHGVRLWDDTKIRVGDHWDDRIGAAIDRSLLAVLLVSVDFVNSGYITDVEIPYLEERGVPLGAVLGAEAPWTAVPSLARVQWAHQDVGREGPITINADGLEATQRELDAALSPLCQRLADRVCDELAARDGAAGSPDRPAEAPTARAAQEPLVPGDAGVLEGCPELPLDYVERRADLERLRLQLLDTDPALGLAGAASDLGLQGQGGIGKTVLATALVRDDEVQRRFPDGLFWVTLGEQPDVVAKQAGLLAMLGADADVRSTIEAKHRLVEAFADRQSLLVVDDVWSGRAAQAFDVNGPGGRVLFTTRDHRVLEHVGATVGRVDVLDDGDAEIFSPARPAGPLTTCPLRPTVCSRRPARWRSRSRWSGHHSAAVRPKRGRRRSRSWSPAATRGSTTPTPTRSRPWIVAISAIGHRQQQLLAALAVFPEDIDIPVTTIRGCGVGSPKIDTAATADLLEVCAGRDLLTLASDHVSLHDLQRDFYTLRADDLTLLHGELVDAHRPRAPARWSGIPGDEPYMSGSPPRSPRRSRRVARAVGVARDAAWLLHRLRNGGRVAVAADLTLARRTKPGDPTLDWLLDGVRAFGHLVLSAHDLTEAAATMRAADPAITRSTAAHSPGCSPTRHLRPGGIHATPTNAN